MKNSYSCLLSRKSLFLLTLAACLGLFAGLSTARADDVFSTDFSRDTFDSKGWTADGNWVIKDFGAGNPGLANNPGPVADFAAGTKTAGTLTKKFEAIANPSSLTLTYTAGFGWGTKDHSQTIDVMLLDDDGTGYIFHVARAKATWGAQWGYVTKGVPQDKMTWAASVIDATQPAVHDGGGLRTFTITRDASGNWSFNGDGWTGGPLQFGDATTTTFSKVVLRGDVNTDEVVFGKVKLEAAK